MTALAVRSAWVARLAAMVFTVFIGLFALDAFEDRGGTLEHFAHFAGHLMPAALCLVIIALAWSRPWVGTLCFAALAIGYAVMAWDHPSWVLLISGMLLVIASLYALQAYTRP